MGRADPVDAVDASNEVFGAHRGFRALHAKGTLLKGTFTATAEAAGLTRAAHMQGSPIPVTVRVSNGGGNPEVADGVPDVRGLAVKFYLPDGSKTDIVAQSAPRFPTSTPQAFVELMRAQKPGPAMAWKLPAFLARNPSVAARLPPNLPALRPLESYARCRYYAVHALRFVDRDGGARYVRYTLVPEAGESRIGLVAARRRGHNYLQDEIRERLVVGPVRFTLELQIARDGDRVDDPAAAWPKGRERVAAGTLELTELDTSRETGGDVLVFDPTRVTDGIELSEDPVLLFRHEAYTESIRRRMEG
jgi:catalase